MRETIENDKIGSGGMRLTFDSVETEWFIEIWSERGQSVELAFSDEIDAEGAYRQLLGGTQNIY